MELAGAGVVVTGGGSGIGAALATRFASLGARVVVNDLNASGAERVAAEIGGRAVVGDAASTEGVRALVEASAAYLGEIDMFCANAGIGTGGGPEASDADWDLAWQVNVMSHVRAARELLPGWLARGRGHFLATVSAAGMLTMLGAAPYSVTKHGALAFAEWMSITYGHRGITVQALCPQGVQTPMLDATGRTGDIVLRPGAITTDVLADAVVEALVDGRFLILPHPEAAEYYVARAAQPERWIGGMRKIQIQVESHIQGMEATR
jgi:NAD(P)-dependent dehydrogenase (short-subunit alcohol dehydrogenase family)